MRIDLLPEKDIAVDRLVAWEISVTRGFSLTIFSRLRQEKEETEDDLCELFGKEIGGHKGCVDAMPLLFK